MATFPAETMCQMSGVYPGKPDVQLVVALRT